MKAGNCIIHDHELSPFGLFSQGHYSDYSAKGKAVAVARASSPGWMQKVQISLTPTMKSCGGMNMQKLRVLGSSNEPPALLGSCPKKKTHFPAMRCGFSDHSTLIALFGRVAI